MNEQTEYGNRFAGQVAVVTGGASGIGRGIALRLAREGCKVVLYDTGAEALEQTRHELRELGLELEGSPVDITDEMAVKEGQLDIMVNCAGIAGPTAVKITDFETKAYEHVLRVNLIGSFLMTKYALHQMQKRNYGRILLLASIAGKEGNPGMAGYSSSKAGVIGLAKGVGKEFAETGITVNALAPAVIRTPLNEKTAPEQLQYMIDRIPMKRLGTVEETAAIACWVVSKEASFNTGCVFDLSGGRATY
jgi:2-dehydro-3-deoxy-L-rhamnonate dehydrogenase (NAD+)